MNLYEMRFNLIKNGVISTMFCSKLAKFKIESYLNEFMRKFKRTHDAQTNSSELQTLIDILFYFFRRHTRVGGVNVPGTNSTSTGTDTANTMTNSYYDPDDDTQSTSTVVGGGGGGGTGPTSDEANSLMTESEQDDDETCDHMLRTDLAAWIKTLTCLLVNSTDSFRSSASNAQFALASLIHFDNLNFVLEHLLRAPDSGQFASLYQFPVISASSLRAKQKIELNSSKSDPIVNLYFDGYIRLVVPFSRPIKQRDAFLFLNKTRIEAFKKRMNKQGDKGWQFVDLEGKLVFCVS